MMMESIQLGNQLGYFALDQSQESGVASPRNHRYQRYPILGVAGPVSQDWVWRFTATKILLSNPEIRVADRRQTYATTAGQTGCRGLRFLRLVELPRIMTHDADEPKAVSGLLHIEALAGRAMEMLIFVRGGQIVRKR